MKPRDGDGVWRMKEMKALLFDVDGTLADTERDGHRVAFNQAFAEAGLDWFWSVELYGELLAVTGGKERIRHYMATYDPTLPQIDDWDAWVAALHRDKTRHYVNALRRGAVPLRPGVARLLAQAREAGLRLGIATTTTAENVHALLKHGSSPQMLEWFEVIAAGDIVAAKKPAPDIYQLALRELGLQPSQCVVLEDSEHGLQSALAAGISTVIVTVNDYTKEHDFSGAAAVLDTLGEPGAPFQVLSGELNGATYLDLNAILRLHQQ
jgi:HAD superfamily hydrolase (TIGR01509 family)